MLARELIDDYLNGKLRLTNVQRKAHGLSCRKVFFVLSVLLVVFAASRRRKIDRMLQKNGTERGRKKSSLPNRESDKKCWIVAKCKQKR